MWQHPWLISPTTAAMPRRHKRNADESHKQKTHCPTISLSGSEFFSYDKISPKTTMDRKIYLTTYASPCGNLEIGSYDDRLCLCDWTDRRHHAAILNRISKRLGCRTESGLSDCNEKAIMQLDDYFSGRRMEFDIPLLFAGTPFQEEVWRHLLDIPYASTESYSSLSRRIGNPAAVRAVANANGANAISIFVPCHRVIGSDGTLTGYGGGLPAKRFLLDIERKHR